MEKFDFTNPENWTFEAAVVLDEPSEEMVESGIYEQIIDDIFDHNNATGNDVLGFSYTMDIVKEANPYSRFATKCTCDHCGAHFKYGAMYRNGDNIAVVGQTCATSRINLDANKYALKKSKIKAKQLKARILGEKRMNALCDNRRETLKYQHHIIQGMASNFRKYGNLTLKQWELAKKVQRESIKREKDAEEERATAKPVIEGRIEITGKILAIKSEENYWGMETKMLVRDDRGFKVWGTYPSALTAEQGEVVTFTATVTKSDDDETFGFYKRPHVKKSA